jgi:hypothetical protein
MNVNVLLIFELRVIMGKCDRPAAHWFDCVAVAAVEIVATLFPVTLRDKSVVVVKQFVAGARLSSASHDHTAKARVRLSEARRGHIIRERVCPIELALPGQL